MIKSKRFRLISIATAAAVTFTVALTGCTAASDGGGGSASADSSLLSAIQDRGVINVGIMPDSPPFGKQSPDGTFEGFDADTATALAEVLGVDVNFVSLTGDTRQPSLASGRTDVDISTYSVTTERALSVEFTDAYYQISSGFLFRKDAPVADFENLDGVSVAVGRGTTNDTVITNNYPDADVKRFDTIGDALQALQSGKVDTAVDSTFNVALAAEKDSTLEAHLPSDPLSPALIAMGVNPGDQVWLNYLNTFIRVRADSGETEALSQKWFNASIPDAVR